MNFFKKNCCDGVYNSFDVHFTSLCDNRCGHCIDNKYTGLNISKPNPSNIANTIINNKNGLDDVLFLGGEPCLFLDELYECLTILKKETNLKLYVTTSIPKTCYDNKGLFYKIIDIVDGINLSVQHYDESVSDEIRCTKSKYNRQEFYKGLPNKHKIRINLNIVKPFLYKKEDVINCLKHYDQMGFNEIKISEIQHGKDFFVSFEKLFGIKIGSPYFHGCQKFIDMSKIIPNFKTKVLLKRSCFLCEDTLKSSILDATKVIYQYFHRPTNKYGVVYEDGTLTKGWI